MRLVAQIAYYVLVVGVPALLLGLALTNKRSVGAVLAGVLGVIACAAFIAHASHVRLSRPVLAIAGLAVGLASVLWLRVRRGR